MNLGKLIVPGIALLSVACAAGERYPSPNPASPRVPRELVFRTTSSAPGMRSWEEAGSRALYARLAVAPSFRERLRFPDTDPHAAAYHFTLVRGQVLRVRIDNIDAQADLFADMFHSLGGGVFRPVQPVSTSGEGIVYEARADGAYVLRLQPPMNRGGLYEVTVLGGGSLRFPVADASLSAIGSVYGDGRDGGRRSHEGVDIFAPRGTPVLAVADGYIRQSRNTPTGGLVIWQTDAERDLTYYYAHLDELRVFQGTRVKAGEVIGTVGNTGNARGTRPHLHFGIYRPGTIPIDPAPLLAGSTEPNYVSGGPLGIWTNVSGNGVRLRSSPSLAGSIIRELRADTPILLLGDAGDWQRVVLHDGTTGFIATRYTDVNADR